MLTASYEFVTILRVFVYCHVTEFLKQAIDHLAMTHSINPDVFI